MGINTNYGYNYNPYLVTGQNNNASVPKKAAFGNASSDMFVSQYAQPQEKGLFEKPSTWIALGLLTAVGIGLRKGGWVRKLWAKLGGKAGQEAAEAAQKAAGKAQVGGYIDDLTKAQITGLKGQRNAALTDTMKQYLTEHGISVDEKLFEGLKGKSASEISTHLTELANSEAAKKAAKEGVSAFDATKLNDWIQKTANVNNNTFVKSMRDAQKAATNLGLAKVTRGTEFEKLAISSQIKALPEAEQKAIFKLANEGKLDEVYAKLQSTLGNDVLKAAGINKASALEGWTNASKVASTYKTSNPLINLTTDAKLSYEAAQKAAQEAAQNLQNAMPAEKWAKVQEAIASGKSITEALTAANVTVGNKLKPLVTAYTEAQGKLLK